MFQPGYHINLISGPNSVLSTHFIPYMTKAWLHGLRDSVFPMSHVMAEHCTNKLPNTRLKVAV